MRRVPIRSDVSFFALLSLQISACQPLRYRLYIQLRYSGELLAHRLSLRSRNHGGCPNFCLLLEFF
jgi:hypothetical protein